MNHTTIKRALSGVAAAVLTFELSAASAEGMDDGNIIAIYNQVNTFDIETAGLGLMCSRNEQVLALAKMVQTDHTAVRQMAADLANKLELPRSLPAGREQATEGHAKVMANLQTKCSDGFDEAYLRHETDFHTNAIDAINKVLIPAAKNEELVKLMKDVLPGFEHHLHETQRVAKELGYN